MEGGQCSARKSQVVALAIRSARSPLMHADGSLSTCPQRESRAFRPGDRRLWTLRRASETAAAHQARARRADDLMPAFAQHIDEGYLYGDCQFSTDASSDTYLRKGVFACYRPLPDAPTPE